MKKKKKNGFIKLILFFFLLVVGLYFFFYKRYEPITIEQDTPFGQITYDGTSFSPSTLSLKSQKSAAVAFINVSDTPIEIEAISQNELIAIGTLEANNSSHPTVITLNTSGEYTFHNKKNTSQKGSIVLQKRPNIVLEIETEGLQGSRGEDIPQGGSPDGMSIPPKPSDCADCKYSLNDGTWKSPTGPGGTFVPCGTGNASCDGNPNNNPPPASTRPPPSGQGDPGAPPAQGGCRQNSTCNNADGSHTICGVSDCRTCGASGACSGVFAAPVPQTNSQADPHAPIPQGGCTAGQSCNNPDGSVTNCTAGGTCRTCIPGACSGTFKVPSGNTQSGSILPAPNNSGFTNKSNTVCGNTMCEGGESPSSCGKDCGGVNSENSCSLRTGQVLCSVPHFSQFLYLFH